MREMRDEWDDRDRERREMRDERDERERENEEDKCIANELRWKGAIAGDMFLKIK